MDDFILPEKWLVIWESKEKFKTIVEYFDNNSRRWEYSSESHYKSGLNYNNSYYNNINPLNPPDNLTIITYDQFVKYVLKEKLVTNEVYKLDLELNQILIKLLSNDN